MHYRGIQEGTGCKELQANYTQKSCLAKCAGNGDNFIGEQEKQAVRNDLGGLPARIVYVTGTISCKDIILGAWNCETVSGSGLGNAVLGAGKKIGQNNCICN